MKKVLALVLAVIMVCTMAMAVTIVDPKDPVDSSDSTTYTALEPGETIAFDLGSDVHYYVDKDGKFVPANNVVTVTFSKGSDLIAKQGWVKVGDGNTAEDYQYQMTLKSDLNKIADEKVAEIVISGITFKSTGYAAVKLLPNDEAKTLSYAFGYEKNELTLAEGDDTLGVVEGKVNVVTALTDKNGKEVSALEVTKDNMTYTFTKGMKFYVLDEAITFEGAKGYTGNSIKALLNNPLNVAAKATVELTTDANTSYKVYAKTADGKILAVAATTTDGVMSFTVPAMSAVLVTTDTLTTSGTTGTTDNGNTTNPGTGANDVVGVAAALAVVALVSGAAISLKK